MDVAQLAPAANVRVAAIVVTFNRLGQLQQTMERLLAEPLDQILVVDNQSTDGTADWLRGLEGPRVLVVTPDRNIGGAGGFELGMRTAVARFDPDWLVLMDDDARPLPGAIARFRRMDRGAWDVLAASVYYPGGSVCEMNRPSVNPFWHAGAFVNTLSGQGRKGFHLPDSSFVGTRTVPIDAASFVGLFIGRGAIARTGYPDGKLFIYGDDVLFTLAMRRAGCRIGFAPELQFEHDCSTYADESRVTRPLWKAYYIHRNSLFMYRSAAGWWFGLLVVPVLAKWLLKARAYGPDRAVFLRLLRLAINDGLRGRRDRSHQDVLAAAADQG